MNYLPQALVDHSGGIHDGCTDTCKGGLAKKFYARISSEKMVKLRDLLDMCALMADSLCKMKSTSEVYY